MSSLLMTVCYFCRSISSAKPSRIPDASGLTGSGFTSGIISFTMLYVFRSRYESTPTLQEAGNMLQETTVALL